MKFRNKIVVGVLALGLLIGGGVVGLTQNAGQTLTNILTTDLIQVYRYNTAEITYAAPFQLTNVYGYYKAGAVATSFNYQFGANVTYAQFAPSGALAQGYVYLAASPSDGARNCFVSTQTVTAVTLYKGATAQTLNNAITAMTANINYCYMYSLSNATWDRF